MHAIFRSSLQQSMLLAVSMRFLGSGNGSPNRSRLVGIWIFQSSHSPALLYPIKKAVLHRRPKFANLENHQPPNTEGLRPTSIPRAKSAMSGTGKSAARIPGSLVAFLSLPRGSGASPIIERTMGHRLHSFTGRLEAGSLFPLCRGDSEMVGCG